MEIPPRLRRQGLLAAVLVVLLIAIDQAIKIWIKTHMVEHEIHEILPWFKIYFLENPGMAYGIELGSKLLLTLFRIVAMGVASWFVVRVVRKRSYHTGFIVVLSLILAGGIGNIIDSVFYGACFSSSVGELAHWVSPGTGYAPWFYGRVVDMFYFPIIHTTYPSWFPIHAGEPYIFFSPIFNFADACISVGVIAMILFFPRTLSRALDEVFGRKKKSDIEPQA